MSDLPDRVAMRLAEVVYRVGLTPRELDEDDWENIRAEATALSSHGLRELIEAAELIVNESRIRLDGRIVCPSANALVKTSKALALLGEPPTVKGEK